MPMNSRMVSLPDLMSGKKKNTTLSLTEGFTGAGHQGALLASAQNLAPKRGHLGAVAESDAAPAAARAAPIYYRTRQLVLSTEKSGHRVPQRMATDLRAHEQDLINALRPLHPLMFQRFDNAQMDRLLRAMPFLRLSSGRWVFGGENDAPDWGSEASSGGRAFLLISGRVSLFADGTGAGDRQEAGPGAVFGEVPFSLGDESVQAVVAGAAHCAEPCIVGALTKASLEAAYADRAFGNKRIANQVRSIPALARVVGAADAADVATDSAQKKESTVVTNAVSDLSKVASKLKVHRGEELLSDNPAEDGVIAVTQGEIEVRGDVTLTERIDAIPPKKVRLRMYIEGCKDLAGDSIFDKLDPYVVVKLGNFKRLQTPVIWNAGPNPIFEYSGVLTYNNEESIDFVVMDHDTIGADDLCGHGSLDVRDIGEGWSGKVPLTRPKRGIFKSEEATMEEPAGKLLISFQWDYEKVSQLLRPTKKKSWDDQVLWTLKSNECWGHEQMAIGGALFKKTLESATNKMKYDITIHNFRLVGSERSGAESSVSSCLKLSRRRFTDFLHRCGREKQFLQACRISALEKQTHIKALAARLTRRWEDQEQAELMRTGIIEDEKQEEVLMEPSHFRVAYRGCKVLITVRNALNLRGGGWFDRLDPYAIVRFRGQNSEFRTSVLQDAGADPIWNCQGFLPYNGETTLEIAVWDYDKYTADDLLAIGSIQVEQFCNGFEGMIPLNPPQSQKSGKKKQIANQSMITIGVQWPPLAEAPGNAHPQGQALENSLTGAASFLQAGMLTSGTAQA
jgi:hypothetical protein